MSSLSELQRAIERERAARGFTVDPVKLMVLLTEEVGEVAKEVKRTWSVNYGDFDPGRFAPELADVFVLVAALASSAGIDLDAAVEEKFFTADRQRHWKSAEG